MESDEGTMENAAWPGRPPGADPDPSAFSMFCFSFFIAIIAS
jgi:hypothetical protein